MSAINLDKNAKKPLYRQIADSILIKIKTGYYTHGQQLPSLNELAKEYGIAKETVVKAFNELKEQNAIVPIHGKGFFVRSLAKSAGYKVMLIVDRLSSYKQPLYSEILKEFGIESTVNIFFHHFNIKVLKAIIHDNVGNYSHFIVIPFEHPDFENCISALPVQNRYLIDIYPRNFCSNYVGVYQDFENDIYNILTENKLLVQKYNSLVLVNKIKETNIPFLINSGFKRFCVESKLPFENISKSEKLYPENGKGYIVTDDDDLVDLVIKCKESRLKIGREVGIISYNESPLKQVISEGLSVFSTDFIQMARLVSKMLKENRRECIKNPFRFIDRKSF
jgi:DNA-binding transcriptional regulator YhcF (GntR family)